MEEGTFGPSVATSCNTIVVGDYDDTTNGASSGGGIGGEGVEGDWVQVEDPDTGEIFYWNEETEEMRRENRPL